MEPLDDGWRRNPVCFNVFALSFVLCFIYHASIPCKSVFETTDVTDQRGGDALLLKAAYLPILSVFVPLGHVHRMPLTSEIGGGRQEKGEVSGGHGWAECVSRMTTLSLAWGPELTLPPLASSFVLSISGIQAQLCTCMHKQAGADTHLPTQKNPEKAPPHSHSLSKAKTGPHVILMPYSSCQACWPIRSSASFTGFSEDRNRLLCTGLGSIMNMSADSIYIMPC